MTLEQLRIFLEVAGRQHVTRAAEALNMTQSAVSAAIAALEDRYAVKLFDRIGRRIELTGSGRGFVAHAQAVIQQAKDAQDFLADEEGVVRGMLRIQASQTVASYYLPPRLMSFQARYPNVELGFAHGNTGHVAMSVQKGQADIGVVEGDVCSPDLTVTPLSGDALAVLVGRNHPWADGRAIGVSDLLAENWVLREKGSGTRSAFDAALESRLDNQRLNILLELPSNEACVAAVEVGRGATAVSGLAAAAKITQGQVVAANFSFPWRDFSIISHRNRRLSLAARAFCTLLQETADN